MGTAKEDLKLHSGERMIDGVLSSLREICREVLVVGGAHGTIPDLREGAGPLGGLESLLASGIDEQYLVCPSDIPLVNATLLRRLLTETTAPVSVFVDSTSGWVHPLPMRISAEALPAATRALDGGTRAVFRFLAELEVDRVELSETEKHLLTNVNTPEDLDSLR